MSTAGRFSADEARRLGEQIGIDWATAPFDVEQFRMGMDVELEHGLHDPHERDRRRPGRDGQDRARAPERVPGLLHPPRPDGRGGEAGARCLTELLSLVAFFQG